jgi:hypothetical protein
MAAVKLVRSRGRSKPSGTKESVAKPSSESGGLCVSAALTTPGIAWARSTSWS